MLCPPSEAVRCSRHDITIGDPKDPDSVHSIARHDEHNSAPRAALAELRPVRRLHYNHAPPTVDKLTGCE